MNPLCLLLGLPYASWGAALPFGTALFGNRGGRPTWLFGVATDAAAAKPAQLQCTSANGTTHLGIYGVFQAVGSGNVFYFLYPSAGPQPAPSGALQHLAGGLISDTA
jgi:hypothetical protein